MFYVSDEDIGFTLTPHKDIVTYAVNKHIFMSYSKCTLFVKCH
jgi:hypothetical protein